MGHSQAGLPNDQRRGSAVPVQLCVVGVVQRLFSKAGLSMTNKRMRLTGDSIERILRAGCHCLGAPRFVLLAAVNGSLTEWLLVWRLRCGLNRLHESPLLSCREDILLSLSQENTAYVAAGRRRGIPIMSGMAYGELPRSGCTININGVVGDTCWRYLY